jgi:hypothetical protein
MNWIMRLFFLLITVSLWGQAGSLYMPLDIKRAYDKSSRSFDGKPGAAYWQNKSEYRIQAELDPATRILKGRESIRYSNNSPDTLTQIVLRLYQNYFKKGGSRDWPVDAGDLHEGVKIEGIVVDDSLYEVHPGNPAIEQSQTVWVIHLKKPLCPSREAILQLDWSFPVASKSKIRMGRYDSTSYFIGYWYPQIAVYDDIDGWDEYIYNGTQEFYNDINDFEVEISLPFGFTAWATGELTNPEQIFTKEFLQTAEKPDQVSSLIGGKDTLHSSIFQPATSHKWKFKATAATDFAFATSDHYVWDRIIYPLDDKTGRTVQINAAYKKSSRDFASVAELSRKTIHYLSHEWPGVPYPYPSITVFNGGGGMEYPMMVNQASSAEWKSTVHLTTHEITHSYFPFFMGSNERKYAWMDEGWAQMLPMEIQQKLAPGYDPLAACVKNYIDFAGMELDIPLMAPTIIYGANVYRPSYRNAAYNRSGVAYYMLRTLLGDDLFKKALQEYIQRWHGRHPIPYDFFFTFNQVAGEDLGWFWKPWFFEFGYPDLALREVFAADGALLAAVEKRGHIPVPVKLTCYFAQGDSVVVERNISVWRNNAKEITLPLPRAADITRIKLGDKRIPDAVAENNILVIRR